MILPFCLLLVAVWFQTADSLETTEEAVIFEAGLRRASCGRFRASCRDTCGGRWKKVGCKKRKGKLQYDTLQCTCKSGRSLQNTEKDGFIIQQGNLASCGQWKRECANVCAEKRMKSRPPCKRYRGLLQFPQTACQCPDETKTKEKKNKQKGKKTTETSESSGDGDPNATTTETNE